MPSFLNPRSMFTQCCLPAGFCVLTPWIREFIPQLCTSLLPRSWHRGSTQICLFPSWIWHKERKSVAGVGDFRSWGSGGLTGQSRDCPPMEGGGAPLVTAFTGFPKEPLLPIEHFPLQPSGFWLNADINLPKAYIPPAVWDSSQEVQDRARGGFRPSSFLPDRSWHVAVTL